MTPFEPLDPVISDTGSILTTLSSPTIHSGAIGSVAPIPEQFTQFTRSRNSHRFQVLSSWAFLPDSDANETTDETIRISDHMIHYLH